MRTLVWIASAALTFSGAVGLLCQSRATAEPPDTVVVRSQMAIATRPGQRLILVDTRRQTILSYRHIKEQGLRLVGARAFDYDTEFEDTAGSTSTETRYDGAKWHEVKQYFDQQRRQPSVWEPFEDAARLVKRRLEEAP